MPVETGHGATTHRTTRAFPGATHFPGDGRWIPTPRLRGSGEDGRVGSPRSVAEGSVRWVWSVAASWRSLRQWRCRRRRFRCRSPTTGRLPAEDRPRPLDRAGSAAEARAEPQPERDPLADAVDGTSAGTHDRAPRPAPPATEMDVRMVHANILSRMGASQFERRPARGDRRGAGLRDAQRGGPPAGAARAAELRLLPRHRQPLDARDDGDVAHRPVAGALDRHPLPAPARRHVRHPGRRLGDAAVGRDPARSSRWSPRTPPPSARARPTCSRST